MFVTTPALEERVPRGLGQPGSRYWAAMMLSTDGPWFLVTHYSRTQRVSQTVAVAWETTLVEMVGSLERGSIVGIGRVSLNRSVGRWIVQDVEELWLPSPQESERSGPLLLRMVGDEHLLNCFLDRVPNEVDGRELLIRVDRGLRPQGEHGR